jgi:hypothetical protein
VGAAGTSYEPIGVVRLRAAECQRTVSQTA